MYVKGKCTQGRMDSIAALADFCAMRPSDPHPNHYLREWRGDRTLEQVCEQIEMLAQEERYLRPNGKPVTMTHATLSRIERGLIPYNQLLLEILAEIYGTEPASLIMRNPENTSAPWALADIVRKLSPDKLAQVRAFLSAINGQAA